MKYIYLVVFAFMLVSCSSKEVQIASEGEKREIGDLVKIPQDVSFFTKELNISVDIYNIQKKI